MVVQRRDGPRLRDNDDDDDDDESYGPVAVDDHCSGDVAVVNNFRCLRVRHSDQKRRASNAAGPLNANNLLLQRHIGNFSFGGPAVTPWIL